MQNSKNILDIGKNYKNNIAKKIKSKVNDNNTYPNEEFFPYACYFDDKTILTQNGELLQIIKIPSFVKNNSSNALFKLRADIQNSLIKHANNTNISFWFNTVRKEVDIIPKNQEHKNDFSRYINDKWNKHNNFNKQYANEIFITIILTNPNKKTELFDNMFKNLFFRSLKKSLKNTLIRLNKILTDIVNKVCDDLAKYNPSILSIVNVDGNYFSEHCKFFSTIVNDDRGSFPLDINMLGYGLANKRVSFGSNTIRVYNNDKNTCMAIISLKDYNNLLLSELDKIIQLDQELVITQSASFLEKKSDYRDLLEEELKVLNLVEDSEIKKLTGLAELKEEADKPDSILNFAISQVIIQIKGKNQDILEKNIKSLFKVLKEIGIIGVREEMFMPTLYWSQLPANFNFIKRLKIIPVKEIGQFVSLYNFPTGKLTQNLWGDAVTVLKTTINTPYFFSFHNTNNEGNTLIVGPDFEFRTMLLNFLISQSIKLVDKVYYIDMKNRSKVFINALNGIYYEFSNKEDSKKNKLSINPFLMKKTESSTNFILEWIISILKTDDDGFIRIGNKRTNLEEEIKRFKPLFIENINSFKSLNDVYEFILEKPFTEIRRILKKWCANGGYNFIFSNDFITDFDSNPIIAFNISNTIFNDEVRCIILKYLLHEIYLRLNENTKTIIAIDEIWDLFDNKYLANDFRQIIEKFSKKNAVFVATTSGSEFFETSFITKSVTDVFTTNIFTHNMKTSIYQKKIFNINEQESRLLSVIKKDSNTFLLKHNKNMVFSSVKFDFIDEVEAEIFASNKITINAMEMAKQITQSNNSTDWLPVMKEIISRYNKYIYEKMIKEQEKRQIEWQESKAQVNH